jgi:hypothetical protein
MKRIQTNTIAFNSNALFSGRFVPILSHARLFKEPLFFE